MKVRIENDNEWYPVYALSDNNEGVECEVDEAKVKDWKRIKSEFTRIQNEMRQACHAALGENTDDCKTFCQNFLLGQPSWTPKPNEECEWEPTPGQWFPCLVLAVNQEQDGNTIINYEIEGETVTGRIVRRSVPLHKLRPNPKSKI